MGGYEPNPRIWGEKGIPKNFNFSLLEPDFNHFETIMKNALKRVPLLNDISIYETWEKITDEKIQKRTKKVFTKENKLYIKISSAPLRSELTNNKISILKKIKKEHNLINEIYFI